MPDDDLITVAEACKLIGGNDTPIDASTYYRGVKAGRYPRPLKVGAQLVRIPRSEVLAVRIRAIAERDAAGSAA